CGERRRHLLDLAGEARDATVDRVNVRNVGFTNHRTRRVVRIRLVAEGDGRVVDFGLAIDEREKASSASDEQNKQTGREWIERAGMPDAARVYAASDDRHDVVGRYAGGFVDEQEACEVSRQRTQRKRVAGVV